MTPEEKDLLVKDLCARLPYGVKVKCERHSFPVTILYAGNVDEVKFKETGGIEHIDLIKPYLRPMSSMTKEEKIELKYKTCPEGTGYFDEKALICPGNHYGEYIPYNFMSVILNWLLAHHFDVRNLIEKGLALEAPKGMYETK